MTKRVAAILVLAALVLPFSGIASAQSAPKPQTGTAAVNGDKPNVDAKKQSETSAEPDKRAAKEGEKSKDPSAWNFVRQWWYPLRHDFSNALQRAYSHYRAGEQVSAANEIEKAISWLKHAKGFANKATQEDLQMAASDLEDFAMQLQSGQPVNAKRLERAFANASTALSRHHKFLANQSVAQNDLKMAGKELLAAADHLRDAARAANYEYGAGIVEFYDRYSPNGHWDESVLIEKNDLEANLLKVEEELQKIAQKLGAKKDTAR